MWFGVCCSLVVFVVCSLLVVWFPLCSVGHLVLFVAGVGCCLRFRCSVVVARCSLSVVCCVLFVDVRCVLFVDCVVCCGWLSVVVLLRVVVRCCLLFVVLLFVCSPLRVVVRCLLLVCVVD